MQTLAATKREKIGKTSRSHVREGKLAAVVYGPKQESTPITLTLKEFEKVFREAGESSVIELTGLGATLQVLVHDIDHDPVKSTPRHVDFYAIEKGAKVEVAVPLNFIGESAAVKAGANLVKVLHELEIEAAPADLPHAIDVDISVLDAVGDQIHVRDLKIPARVTVKVDEEEVVALIQEVEEEPEEPAAALDMAAIEVEKKGKTDEEGAEAEAAPKE